MSTFTLRKASFRKWLAAAGENHVGRPNTSCDCPIARYIRATLGPASAPSICLKEYFFSHRASNPPGYSYTHRKPPPWAIKFIETLDDRANHLNYPDPPHPGARYAPVTGVYALEILDHLTS